MLQKVLSGFQMLKKILSGVPDVQKDTFGGHQMLQKVLSGVPSPDAQKDTFGGPQILKRYFRGFPNSQKVLSGFSATPENPPLVKSRSGVWGYTFGSKLH